VHVRNLGRGIYARPTSLSPRPSQRECDLLVNAESAKNGQLERFPKVTMAWSHDSSYKYVTISGHAKVTNDRSKIEQLWEKTDEAWWDSAQDPEIRLITVAPDEAELWDSPGKMVAVAKMVMSAITGAKPDVGDNAKVEL